MMTMLQARSLRRIVSLLVLGLMLATAVPAGAVTLITWTSSASTDWNTPGNWDIGDVPDNSSERAILAGTGLVNPVLSAPVTIGELWNGAGAQAYTIGGASNTMTFNPNTISGLPNIVVVFPSTQLAFDVNVTIGNSGTTSTQLSLSSNAAVSFNAGTMLTTSNTTFQTSGAGAVNVNCNYAGSQLWVVASNSTVNFNPQTVTNTANNLFRVNKTGTLNVLTDWNTGSGKGRIEIGGSTANDSGTARLYLTGNGVSLSRDIRANSSGNADGTQMIYVIGSNVSGAATTAYTGSLTMDNTAGRGKTYQLFADDGDTLTFSGLISGGNTLNAGSGQSFTTKTGNGTVILTNGANSFVTGVTVATGTLVVNNTSGSATGSGAVAVLSGATLGGSGFIASGISGDLVHVQSGGRIAPGASPGVLTVSNATGGQSALHLSAGSQYVWDLAADTTSGAGTAFDQIAVTAGNVTIDPAAVLLPVFGGSTSGPTANAFWQQDQRWNNIINLSGGGTISGVSFVVDNAAWSTLGSFSTVAALTGDGVDLLWTAATVPEPTVLQLSVGLAVAMLMRRRRA